MKFKLSEESAQEQINLFCDWYDIDQESENLKGSLNKFLKGVMLGRLEVFIEDDSLKVKQIFKFPIKINKDQIINDVIYKEMDGNAKILIENPGEKPFSNVYTLLAHLSDTSINLYKKMKLSDLNFCESVGVLFFS